MIRNTVATQSNKWQRKRIKNDEVMSLNVNQRYIMGRKGKEKKTKK